jgi:Ca2+-dependent lipid-binding protein
MSGYKVHVGVIRATDLPKMDLFGTADPFCVLGILSHRSHSRTASKKNDQNPVWSEFFWFDMPGKVCSLEVRVEDKDRVSNSDLIGTVIIPLGNLIPGQLSTKWYDIKRARTRTTSGKLLLSLRVEGGAQEELVVERAFSGLRNDYETYPQEHEWEFPGAIDGDW